jgi:hypothetical protein
MASNLHEEGSCTQSFDQPPELEMGVTPDQRSECQGHLSTTSSSNEQVFGEDFEYVVS